MPQAAMVLEGGGMRGVYTAGVLDFLLDHHIHINKVYGVSAGACHACSYLSRQRGRAVRTVVDYIGDPRYAGVRSLLKTGDFFGVRMIYDDIPNKLLPYDYEAYVNNAPEFYAVATNCATGLPEYLRVGDLRRDTIYIQASSSLPLLSRRVRIGGKDYLDGGVADSIPLARSIADGNGKNLVVLTQHRGYRKEPAGMRTLMRMRYRGSPGLVRSLENRHQRYNDSLELAYRQEEEGNAFLIQPSKPVEIDRLEKDRDKLMRLYQEGINDARKCSKRLLEFLQQVPTAASGI